MGKTLEIKKVADEIIDFLEKNKLWYDTTIYYDNKRVNSTGKIEEGINVKDYIEYGNPETITMAFEGPLYHELNGYSGNNRIYNQFEKLIKKHGYYFELGYAWSLSLYEL